MDKASHGFDSSMYGSPTCLALHGHVHNMRASHHKIGFCGAQAYDISNLKRLRELELRADESLHETFVAELARLPPSLRSASLIAPQVWSVRRCVLRCLASACLSDGTALASLGLYRWVWYLRRSCSVARAPRLASVSMLLLLWMIP